MARPGVLFVGNFLSGSGMHRHYCEDLADRLESTWSVTRTSSRRGRITRILDMMRVAWRTRDAYDVAHVDVFSGPAFTWAEVVSFELRKLHKPIVLTLRGGNLPAFCARWPRRAARLFASAAIVTVPTTYLQLPITALARSPSVTIPNAIDLARYPYPPRAVGPRLVWLRAFHAIYNPVLAIEVLARVRAEIPSATLLMVGPDKGDGTLQETERRIAALGLVQHVTIEKGVPKLEVPARLAEGTVYLNTANIDNSPITVVEAMACGLAVVTTNVGGIPHLVEHGRDGLVVPPREPEAMANAVLSLLKDPRAIERLSREGRAHAAACDWTNVLGSWNSVLETVRRQGAVS